MLRKGSPARANRSACLPFSIVPISLPRPDTLGGPAGGGLDGLHGGEAAFDHQLDLAGVVAVDETAGIGTRSDFGTRLDGLVEAVLVGVEEGLGAGLDVGRAYGGVELVRPRRLG